MDDKEHDDICIRHCIVHELFVVFIALFFVLNDKLFVCVVMIYFKLFVIDFYFVCLIIFAHLLSNVHVVCAARALYFCALLERRARAAL